MINDDPIDDEMREAFAADFAPYDAQKRAAIARTKLLDVAIDGRSIVFGEEHHETPSAPRS